MTVAATQDPRRVSVVIAGYKITGFASDDSFNAAYDAPRFSKIVGVLGLGAFAKSHDKSGTVTLTLMANSTDNDVLNTLQKADELASGGVLYPLAALDGNGRSLVAGNVRITTPPTFSNTAQTKTWVMQSTKLIISHGGMTETPVVTTVAEAQALIDAASPIPDAV